MSFQYYLLSTQIAGSRYYYPKELRARRPLQVVCAGWESCLPDYRVKRETFPWLAVELVVKGEGWLTVGRDRFRLRAGLLFCYGPGVAYEMETDAERPLQKYFVDYTGAEGRRATMEGPLPPGQARQALYPQELREIFDRIIFEGNRRAELSAEIAANYLRVLFQKLHQCADTAPGHGASRAMASYLRGKAFLEEHFARLANLEEAARELGMTPETLCRLFQRFSRVTPYQYWLQLRINLAIDFLLGTDLLVKEVGREVGFDDPLHFSRLFKRIQGVSPEAFRRLRKRAAR